MERCIGRSVGTVSAVCGLNDKDLYLELGILRRQTGRGEDIRKSSLLLSKPILRL